MTQVLLFLMACNPSACVKIGVDNPFGDDPTGGDAGTVVDDTGDTGPIDTGPVPPCDVPEIEPNSPYADAQDLPMEQWACGTFSDDDDSTEIFYFENEEAGWLRIWGRAFDIGSLADLTLAMSSSDGPYGASKLSNPDSTDATLVFPVDDSYGFYASVSEHYGRNGDAYNWQLMASAVKAPIEWTREESDSTTTGSNDTSATAELLADGDRVFGRMNTASDYDWYSLKLGEGRSDVVLNIDAWSLGSPADTRIYFYKPDGTQFATDGNSVENGLATKDPYLTASPTEAGTWLIKVVPDVDDVGNTEGGGGTAFWYVLDVSVTVGD